MFFGPETVTIHISASFLLIYSVAPLFEVVRFFDFKKGFFY